MGQSSNPKYWYMFLPKCREAHQALRLFLILRSQRCSNLSFTLEGIFRNSKDHQTPRSITEVTGPLSHPLAHLGFTKESAALCIFCFPGPTRLISSMHRRVIVYGSGRGPGFLQTAALGPEQVHVVLSKRVKSAPSLVLSVHTDEKNSICRSHHCRIGSRD